MLDVFIFSPTGEGRHIMDSTPAKGSEVQLTDQFFLGSSQIPGALLLDLPLGSAGFSRPPLDSSGLRQYATGGDSPMAPPIGSDVAACPGGFDVNWNSPFGPFRIDIAHVHISQEGGDTELFMFIWDADFEG